MTESTIERMPRASSSIPEERPTTGRVSLCTAHTYHPATPRHPRNIREKEFHAAERVEIEKVFVCSVRGSFASLLMLLSPALSQPPTTRPTRTQPALSPSFSEEEKSRLMDGKMLRKNALARSAHNLFGVCIFPRVEERAKQNFCFSKNSLTSELFLGKSRSARDFFSAF